MSSERLQLVPVRIPPEQVDEIDELVAVLGGNRSEFIRMAVDERLRRMRPLMVTLADAAKVVTLADVAQVVEGMELSDAVSVVNGLALHLNSAAKGAVVDDLALHLTRQEPVLGEVTK